VELTAAEGERWLLLDKSALVRAPRLDPALGEPCLCAITRFEMLYSARSPGALHGTRARAGRIPRRIDAETIAIARTARHELAAKSRHRVPIPNLLIAACASSTGRQSFISIATMKLSRAS
jgi:predicted nucleic acid-binding protein